MNRLINFSLPNPFAPRIVFCLLLLGSNLLFGCGEKTASNLPDAKSVEAHKPHPPIPSAVPQGMNK